MNEISKNYQSFIRIWQRTPVSSKELLASFRVDNETIYKNCFKKSLAKPGFKVTVLQISDNPVGNSQKMESKMVIQKD